jgi:hypothetical protein
VEEGEEGVSWGGDGADRASVLAFPAVAAVEVDS